MSLRREHSAPGWRGLICGHTPNTINPPGAERACARYLGKRLEHAGFRVAYHEFAETRTSLFRRKIPRRLSFPSRQVPHAKSVPLRHKLLRHSGELAIQRLRDDVGAVIDRRTAWFNFCVHASDGSSFSGCSS